MISPPRHLACFLAIVTAPVLALAQGETKLLSSGVVNASDDPGDRRFPVDIPSSMPFATFTLDIAEPDKLDIDLRVLDGDGGNLLCESVGIGRTEVCHVRRPSSGRVTVVVEPFDDRGASEYALRMFLSAEDRRPMPGGSVLLENEPLPLGEEAQEFQLYLEPGQIAVLRLTGRERFFGASDAAGKSIASVRVDSVRQQVVLGVPYSGSQSIYRGIDEPMGYQIRVGRLDTDRFASPSVLSMVLAGRGSPYGYVIPFSLSEVLPFPSSATESFRQGVDGDRAIFAVPELFRGARGASAMLEGDEFDIALCDQYGRTLDISEREVLFDAAERDGVVIGAQQARSPIAQSAVPGDVYLVVFRSPFVSNVVPAREFQLRIVGR